MILTGLRYSKDLSLTFLKETYLDSHNRFLALSSRMIMLKLWYQQILFSLFELGPHGILLTYFIALPDLDIYDVFQSQKQTKYCLHNWIVLLVTQLEVIVFFLVIYLWILNTVEEVAVFHLEFLFIRCCHLHWCLRLNCPLNASSFQLHPLIVHTPLFIDWFDPQDQALQQCIRFVFFLEMSQVVVCLCWATFLSYFASLDRGVLNLNQYLVSQLEGFFSLKLKCLGKLLYLTLYLIMWTHESCYSLNWA